MAFRWGVPMTGRLDRGVSPDARQADPLLPLADIQAEQSLLSRLLSGADTPETLRADLPGFSAEAFADPIHAAIYRLIESLTDVGGAAYLQELTRRESNEHVTGLNLAARIQRHHRHRQILGLADELHWLLRGGLANG